MQVCRLRGFAWAPTAEAQLANRLKRAAQRGAERALERNAQRKTEEAVDKAFEKPEKESRRGGEDKESIGLEDDEGGSGPSAASGDSNARPAATEGGASERVAFSKTSKFDFEPGAEIIRYDDFSRTEVGDLPTGYNTMGTAEILTVNTAPGKWLKITGASGQVVAYDFAEFPDDFTLEFDLIHDIPYKAFRYSAELGVMFTSEGDPEAKIKSRMEQVGDRNVVFWIDRDISAGWHKGFEKSHKSSKTKGNSARINYFTDDTRGLPQRISIWRQGKRMRMYINEQKEYDIPLAWSGDEKVRGLRFIGQMSVPEDAYLISNVRLAKGAPDTRSTLETTGKLTTYGITFASGSSVVEPGSAGTLKRLSQTLEANPDMRIRITGHTDGDGTADSNLALSEARAKAVAKVLSENYGIAKGRLETAGKGESDPVAGNDTPSGKAQNRRVVLEVL